MAIKGKKAWLITWEGSEFEHFGKCKIVAILHPTSGKEKIQFLLRHLFCVDYKFTLSEKMSHGLAQGKDQF